MSDLNAAKRRVVLVLSGAGMIHPYTGQEGVVLAALDEFAASVAAKVMTEFASAIATKPEPESEPKLDTHAEEIEDAANNHGQGLGPVLVPSAEDLDAVAAERQAKQATSGNVAQPEPEVEAEVETEPAPGVGSSTEPVSGGIQSQEDEHGD